jgi:hypothetical protein
MHPKLIQVAKIMARWPVVGPCIRYAARVVRQGPPPPPASISAPDTQENLLQSVPVTLRHLERELHAVRTQLSEVVLALQTIQANQTIQATSTNHATPSSFASVAPKGPSAGVDLISSTWDLPFECGLTKSIAIGEWLQRHSTEALRHTVLPTLFRLLAPGGELEISVLDASALLKNPKASLRSINGKGIESHRSPVPAASTECAESAAPAVSAKPLDLVESDEPSEPKEPTEPQTLFTRESLEGLLTDAGFTNVTVTTSPSTARLQAIATKPQ